MLLRTEHPLLRVVRLRSLRAVRWLQSRLANDADTSGQGLVITHAEVERYLRDPWQTWLEEDSFYRSDPEACVLSSAIESAQETLAEDPVWFDLCKRFELAQDERDLLSLAAAVDLDPALRRVYAYLHDDLAAINATPHLAARLFTRAHWSPPSPGGGLMRWALATPVASGPDRWGRLTPWQADAALARVLAEGLWSDPELDETRAMQCAGSHRVLPHCGFPDALRQLQERYEAARSLGQAFIAHLVAPAGAGRKTLAAQFAARNGSSLLVCDAVVIAGGAESAPALALRAVRAGKATGAMVCFDHGEALSAEAARAVAQPGVAVILCRTSREEGSIAHPDIQSCCVELDPLSREARSSFWQALSEAPVPALVTSRRLFAGEIASLAFSCDGTRAPVRVPSPLVQVLPLPYRWDDLVLQEETRSLLREFQQQAELRWYVAEDWGFSRLTPLGSGITALFAGPSGTGKTMAAQVMARELGLDLFRVDLATVVNKYIGETEKHLKELFDTCDRANALLFFDEADALFGNRTQVKDAHDRFANIEIDYLLQRLEQFDGLAILATNRKNDVDSAFLRRVRFLIDFLPPGAVERRAIWRKALPDETPAGEVVLEGIDFDALATKLTLTGASIKSAALGAAFLARAAGSRITMEHVLAAVRRETAKQGGVYRAHLWGESDG